MSSTSSNGRPWVPFVAGATGGLIAAVITSPLEVVKTRLQSAQYHQHTTPAHMLNFFQVGSRRSVFQTVVLDSTSIMRVMSGMVRTEGFSSLWRGINATVVGVVPARAIYFATYNNAKATLISYANTEHTGIHMLAAACATITTSTLTNPFWVLKTRLQLSSTVGPKESILGLTSLYNGAKDIYHTDGLRGFYRGLSASYMGLSETAIQWALYEKLKAYIHRANLQKSQELQLYFFAASCSKLCACVLAYPHGQLLVARLFSRLARCICCTGRHTGTQRSSEPGFAKRLRAMQCESIAASSSPAR
eukprot:m.766655 g.766655  ORF g.766655 m.766655 type:complete len:305 (+) comp59065_c0_seq34:200-1114(+)